MDRRVLNRISRGISLTGTHGHVDSGAREPILTVQSPDTTPIILTVHLGWV